MENFTVNRIKPPNILVVDDEEDILYLFDKAMKRAGYSCRVTGNGEQALAALAEESFDVVISDINMPGMSGIDLSKRILKEYSSDIIVMTGKVNSYHYHEIINIGVSDFVEKPFAIQELILRVNRVLRERRLRRAAKQSHDELRKAYIDSIHRLVMASEFKDENTGDHIVRIGEYSRVIAIKLGWSKQKVEIIGYAAPMHDVGKIGIPDKIMLKPGKLTAEEFNVMKNHTIIGAKLLSRSNSEILKTAKDIALCHHEKFNGKGYPNGISGEHIPISGRIVAICDAFDALTSTRPYKDPYPPEMALDIIRRERGQHFDPVIVDLFMAHFDEFLEIREAVGAFETVDLSSFMLSERDQESLCT